MARKSSTTKNTKTTKTTKTITAKNTIRAINARTTLEADLAALAADTYYCEDADGCAYLSYDPRLCFDEAAPTPAPLTPAQLRLYPTQITFFEEA